MGHYTASATKARNFSLMMDNVHLGELKYGRWYSFKAEIVLADNSIYQLEPKGFWESKIELQKEGTTVLYFEMGWKGIVITTLFNGMEIKYLLTLKGLFSSKYLLIDKDEKELLAVDADLKWTKASFDFTIDTTKEFDNFENKELLLLTILHCINYNMAVVSSGI